MYRVPTTTLPCNRIPSPRSGRGVGVRGYSTPNISLRFLIACACAGGLLRLSRSRRHVVDCVRGLLWPRRRGRCAPVWRRSAPACRGSPGRRHCPRCRRCRPCRRRARGYRPGHQASAPATADIRHCGRRGRRSGLRRRRGGEHADQGEYNEDGRQRSSQHAQDASARPTARFRRARPGSGAGTVGSVTDADAGARCLSVAGR